MVCRAASSGNDSFRAQADETLSWMRPALSWMHSPSELHLQTPGRTAAPPFRLNQPFSHACPQIGSMEARPEDRGPLSLFAKKRGEVPINHGARLSPPDPNKMGRESKCV